MSSPQTDRKNNTMKRVPAGKVGEQGTGFSATIPDAKPYPFTENDRWNVVNKSWRSKTSNFLLSKISAVVIINIHGLTSKYVKK